MIAKIISGCQSGADRAGADIAIEFGIPYSGYVPKGRRAEDGPIPDKYQVIELDTFDYPTRTKRNIAESDCTLLFTTLGLTGGSLLTHKLASELGKPILRIDLDKMGDYVAAVRIVEWLKEQKVAVVNIAGSRESKKPGVALRVASILRKVLADKDISGSSK